MPDSIVENEQNDSGPNVQAEADAEAGSDADYAGSHTLVRS